MQRNREFSTLQTGCPPRAVIGWVQTRQNFIPAGDAQGYAK